MRDVSRLGLQKEQQISVFLRLLVIWEETFLQIRSIFEMACNFILLYLVSLGLLDRVFCAHLLQSHAILNQQGNSRIQISDILLQHEILL